MGSLDGTTWQALGLVLTILGLGISFFVWRRRGPASGLRAGAWALLPLAAGLTGTLRLLWEIGDSVASWGIRLVFSPLVWLGIVVAGVSAVLFVVSSAIRRRGIGTGGTRPRSPGRERSQLSQSATRVPASFGSDDGPDNGTDDGTDDIEAILRKHGIS